jgi:GNAT superfamily N-acetyltransferase
MVRKARIGDVARIAACLAAAFEPYRAEYTVQAFRDTVPTPEGVERRMRDMTVLVAENDQGEIVGTIACEARTAGEGHLRGMAVDPRFHGHGFAEQLLSAAEEELRHAGCSLVTLDTTRPLERAIRFYLRHGYAPTGVVRDFFGMPIYEYAKNP